MEGVSLSFSIKNIFCDKIDLRLYFDVAKYVFSLFSNFFEDFESQFNLISQIETLLKKFWITKDLKVKTNSLIMFLSISLKLCDPQSFLSIFRTTKKLLARFYIFYSKKKHLCCNWINTLMSLIAVS